MQKSCKQAFTLAEILIVLTIIGVMAVMTIPSLIQGTNSQQKITLFKKAFNALTNAYATEFAVKAKPTNSKVKGGEGDDKNNAVAGDSGLALFTALANQLNVKYFVLASSGAKEYNKTTVLTAEATTVDTYWIVTEDGIGYRVERGGIDPCQPKLDVNAAAKDTANTGGTAATKAKSCFVVRVDVGGLKTTTGDDSLCSDGTQTAATDVNDLSCDQTLFFVSDSGITSGHPDNTITGRIISKE